MQQIFIERNFQENAVTASSEFTRDFVLMRESKYTEVFCVNMFKQTSLWSMEKLIERNCACDESD